MTTGNEHAERHEAAPAPAAWELTGNHSLALPLIDRATGATGQLVLEQALARGHTVTGHDVDEVEFGFIGCNLVSRLLSRGDDVLIYDNLSRRGAERNLEWLRRRRESGGVLYAIEADGRYIGDIDIDVDQEEARAELTVFIGPHFQAGFDLARATEQFSGSSLS